MSTWSIRAVLLVALALAGCFPGDSGWKCESTDDCNTDLTCASFIAADHYCVAKTASKLDEKDTFGWAGVVGGRLIFITFFSIVSVLGLQRLKRPRALQVAAPIAVAVLTVVLSLAIGFKKVANRSAGAAVAQARLDKMRAVKDRVCRCKDQDCLTKEAAAFDAAKVRAGDFTEKEEKQESEIYAQWSACAGMIPMKY